MNTKLFGMAARVAPCIVGLAVVAGIAFQPVPAAAVDPGPKCESAKEKAAGKNAKCQANVFSKSIKKAEAPEAAKLTKCSEKILSAFTKADDKGGVDCPTTGDGPSIEALVDACVADVIADLGGAPGASPPDEASCQSKKAKEAGKYLFCRLKESAKGTKKGIPPVFTKCEDKISDKWAKIEEKPCATTGDLASVQADLDACWLDVTDSLSGVALCGNGNLNAGEQCDDGNTTNGDGCSDTCMIEATVEYQQDFEGLFAGSANALADDGWLVGANVFAGLPPGGAFLYNYFAFPAPNGGAAFSAIATGEGGASQGAQQMSIYNDYNNGGEHSAGNTVEANVFQERTIVAGDVGRTFTFQFDHKLGNLNDPGDPECPSTQPGFVGTPCNNSALAFIKVFDPGFALLDFPTADMTLISTTWGTTSVTTAPIPPAAVGGVIQFGALNKASLFQPSGIFYDNLSFSSLP